MKKQLFLTVFVLISLNLYSQNIHQWTYWTRFYAKIKLNDAWSLQTEADNRRIFSLQPDKQLQFISHTHLHRKLGKNREGSLGFSYSVVWQGKLTVPELRLFQEFYVFQNPASKIRLTHRFRTEQRWFHNYQKEALTEGYNFKFRARYMTRFDYTASKNWTFKANQELMFHHNAFDQQRLYGGAEYKINAAMSVELGYLKLWQKRNTMGYFDRDNVRFTWSQNFD